MTLRTPGSGSGLEGRTTTAPGAVAEFVLLFPVLDDWESLREVLTQLDVELTAAGLRADVCCVDDGSTALPPHDLAGSGLRSIGSVQVIALRGNFGHQRAIATGLSHLAVADRYAAAIIMDADGEDRPSDVPRLIAAHRGAPDRVIFAQRTRRSEGFLFSAGYMAYRLVHRALTGIPVNVGNFSLVPRRQLHRLVVTSDLWNHYAAAIVHARLPTRLVPTTRGMRVAGYSSMNYQGLVRHGLSAMSVYADRIGTRLLIAGVSALGLFTAMAVTAIMLHARALVGAWTVPVALSLVVICAQACTALLVFVLAVLRARSEANFIPIRDCPNYVEDIVTLRDAP